MKTKTVNEIGRTCVNCGGFKTWPEFVKLKHGTNGRNGWCKPCWRARDAKARKAAKPMTQNLLKEALVYDPDTGHFTYNRGKKKGQRAGCTKQLYVRIRIEGRYYFAHRLAWLYTHGTMPNLDIDHINQDKHDNRLANLRLATRSENRQNVKYNPRKCKGVTRYQKVKGCMWVAAITVNKKYHYLGAFDSLFEAAAARRSAECRLHTHAPP